MLARSDCRARETFMEADDDKFENNQRVKNIVHNTERLL